MSVTEVNPQPPPLQRKAADGPWNIVASVIGAVVYFLVMYRFQTYTERNNMPGSTYALFAAIMFLLGFGLGLVATKSPARAVTFSILGVCAAHSVIIWIDLQEDPSNHNLLPFEFVYYIVLCSPAYLSGWLSHVMKRPRQL